MHSLERQSLPTALQKALEMGPEERSALLGEQKLAQHIEDDADITESTLRYFLNQFRMNLYFLLGSFSKYESFYAFPGIFETLTELTAGKLELRHLKIFTSKKH
jgi:hypothetical protein